MVVFGGLHLINIIVGVIFGAGLVLTGGWGAFGIGWLLYSVINLVALVLWIVLMVKAYQGAKVSCSGRRRHRAKSGRQVVLQSRHLN